MVVAQKYRVTKVIDEEEDISHEEGENSQISVADGDGNHAPIINNYELLMNRELMGIQTAETTEPFIYYDDMVFMVTFVYAYAKR